MYYVMRRTVSRAVTKSVVVRVRDNKDACYVMLKTTGVFVLIE